MADIFLIGLQDLGPLTKMYWVSQFNKATHLGEKCINR